MSEPGNDGTEPVEAPEETPASGATADETRPNETSPDNESKQDSTDPPAPVDADAAVSDATNNTADDVDASAAGDEAAAETAETAEPADVTETAGDDTDNKAEAPSEIDTTDAGAPATSGTATDTVDAGDAANAGDDATDAAKPIQGTEETKEMKESDDTNNLTEIRGTPRDETEPEKEKKEAEAAKKLAEKTPDTLTLGEGWSVKQTSKLSKIKGFRGETLHLHTIIVNFIVSRKNLEGEITDKPHKLVFKHYEKRTASKIPNTSKEVKLDDRLVMSRKKDKESSIPFTEVYLEARKPEKIGVMINPIVNEKKKKVKYTYEILVNDEPIEKAYETWLKLKKSAGKGTKKKKTGSKKKGSKKKTTKAKKKGFNLT